MLSRKFSCVPAFLVHALRVDGRSPLHPDPAWILIWVITTLKDEHSYKRKGYLPLASRTSLHVIPSWPDRACFGFPISDPAEANLSGCGDEEKRKHVCF